MKPLRFAGDSRKDFLSFPKNAQHKLGYQLLKVQEGMQPADSKPMPSIGVGVEEIRIWVESGTFRVIYLARRPEAVYVLHAFQKKSQATNKRDIQVAQRRLANL